MHKNTVFNALSLLFAMLFLTAGNASNSYAAETAELEWDVNIGVANVSSSSPWTGSNTQNNTLPFIYASIGNWHFGGRELVSYQAVIDNQWGVAISINSRVDSYRHSLGNDEVFSGYIAPDSEFIAKLGVSYDQFSVLATRDVSNNSESSSLSLSVEHPFYQQRWLIIKANASVHWYDSDYTNYNYGVSDQQADNSVGRFAYQADAALNYELGISATYFINREWFVIGSLSQTRLDHEITDSPLVEEDFQRVAAIILVYQL